MEFRKAFLDESHNRLERMKANIYLLRNHFQLEDRQEKVDLQKLFEELKEKERSVQSQLDELKNASHDSWEQLKEGFEQVSQELEEALEDAVSKVAQNTPEQ